MALWFFVITLTLKIEIKKYFIMYKRDLDLLKEDMAKNIYNNKEFIIVIFFNYYLMDLNTYRF